MNDLKIATSNEVSKIVPTAGVVATRGNSILLVCHEGGSGHKTGIYGLPSGRVDNGETDLQAAVRELEEETGLIVSEEALLEFENNYVEADVPRKNGAVERMKWRVFKIDNLEGNLRATTETIPQWLSLKQIEQLEAQNKLAPNVLKMVKAALKNE